MEPPTHKNLRQPPPLATSTITPIVTVAATAATFSVYVKQGTGATTANTFTLRNDTSATNLIAGRSTYSTGVFTYITGRLV